MRPMGFATLALALAALHPSSSAAQADASPEDAIDAVFAAFDRPAGPGCAVGVVQAGRLTFARGYGDGSLDHSIPLGPRSVFYLASVSKQFTAAAIVIAEHEGYLSMDDEVRGHLAEFPEYDAPVTIGHLVHHTAGVRDYLTLMTLAGTPLENVLTDEAMLSLITRQKELNFEPGTEYLYSNSGYVLLAEIVKRATGRSLREYAHEKIFEPLGMTSTHFHDDRFHPIAGRVFSYQWSGESGWRTDYLMHFDKVGDGGLYSSVEDLAAWDAAFYDDRLGVPDFAGKMYRRGVLAGGDTIAYARGLGVGAYRGLDRVAHGGGLMGFRTMIARYPAERTTVITLCNAGIANSGLLSRAVEEAVLGDVYPEGTSDEGTQRAAPPDEAVREGIEVDPTPWAGTYRSEELDASWDLEVEAGALVVNHPIQGRGVFRQVEPGRFVAEGLGLEMRFEESAGPPEAFVLEAGRVRNLRFVRVR